MRRLAKKGRAFDCVVLDPPTFSQSKERGAFRVEKDWGRLVAAALPPGQTGGGLVSVNAADWPRKNFSRTGKGLFARHTGRFSSRIIFPNRRISRSVVLNRPI